ncbi:MAG: cysteine synthase A [Kofleriaceae bacterium]|jgi:cysteine synthase A|nr:cysteine synthase A [Kofleriaceae bacterium]MBP6837213.1 cysteine synthase A [Kofleriaceae bacterium]MBP9205502.1 cysteine synthase A [Kofleriaceae bacterium]
MATPPPAAAPPASLVAPAPNRCVTSPLALIGRTAVIRLRGQAGAGEVWAKCEHQNPGGSVKDRIALAMIEAAEAAGRITPGQSTIIEPTSGNTGIGLALVCAAKGYRLILTMPESMSLERRALLAAYGAEIVLTPEQEVMAGAVARAEALVAATPGAYMPDQFRNPANPEVHRTTTAVELMAQLGDGPIDAFVAGIGTGGTITGVGSVLRTRFPKVRIVGLEPARSAVLSGQPAGPHRIQGIGAGFVPANLDRAVLTELRTVDDRDAWTTARELAEREGILVGISAGANVWAARQLARELGPGRRVATVLCDTGERYFSLAEYFA